MLYTIHERDFEWEFLDFQRNSSDRALEKDAYYGIATGKNFEIR